jgi:hypothetical protein
MKHKLINLTHTKHFRIIPSTYPPINFFEDLVNPDEMDILFEIESLTNERLRETVGDLFQVSPEDRVTGPGSSVVMAAFTHIHFPSRFTDGSYGIYYAALDLDTAITETAFHRERFLKYTNEMPGEITMRVYAGKILKPLYDLRSHRYDTCYDKHDYRPSQEVGQTFKTMNAWGMIYHSVRHTEGQCIALLRPPATSIPSQTKHLKYCWNGHKITNIFEVKALNFS